jgi:hypothetical protein
MVVNDVDWMQSTLVPVVRHGMCPLCVLDMDHVNGRSDWLRCSGCGFEVIKGYHVPRR